MRDKRTPQEKERDRKIGQRAEEVASWYFRLNGFLSLPGFVVHLDQDKAEVGNDGILRYQRTEADLIGVRFVESKEIINFYGEKKSMEDHFSLTSLCSATKQALFVLVEVKAGLCMMNGPWTNRRKENMQRVVRRLGFAISDDQVEKISRDMYDIGRYEDDYYVLQYICIGNEKNPAIDYRYKKVAQIDWVEIGNFLINRFKLFPEKTPDGQVHDQWPEFGKKFGKYITSKVRSGRDNEIKSDLILQYIRTGEFI